MWDNVCGCVRDPARARQRAIVGGVCACEPLSERWYEQKSTRTEEGSERECPQNTYKNRIQKYK